MRNVRNFWIDADIDGRAGRMASGPVRKDGGFDLDILARDNGSPVMALRITGRANHDGTLTLRVWDASGTRELVHREFKR